MRTSARNQFEGEVVELKHGAVNDEVTLRTQDGLEIVAVITHGSATSLGLAAGKKAFALVKASSVIVMVDVAKSQVSHSHANVYDASKRKVGMARLSNIIPAADLRKALGTSQAHGRAGR